MRRAGGSGAAEAARAHRWPGDAVLRARVVAWAPGHGGHGLCDQWASAGQAAGPSGRGQAGAGRAFGLGPFQ
jgi:hypothetical protein